MDSKLIMFKKCELSKNFIKIATSSIKIKLVAIQENGGDKEYCGLSFFTITKNIEGSPFKAVLSLLQFSTYQQPIVNAFPGTPTHIRVTKIIYLLSIQPIFLKWINVRAFMDFGNSPQLINRLSGNSISLGERI